MMEEHQLGGKLLAGVSRSFYLTLKALPAGLREPLSIAYLLARAADTVADTVSVPAPVRLEALREFDRFVQAGDPDREDEREFFDRARDQFAAGQTSSDEADLMRRLPELFAAFRRLPPRQSANIRGVLQPIVLGQTADIERFPADGGLRALSTAAELDHYTWQVAGCVGEFWTRLCDEEIEDAWTGAVSLEAMMGQGRRYGQGLQLVNILRDVGRDLAAGRCYFPLEEIEAAGLTLDAVRIDPGLLAPVCAAWQRRCREHLACGIEYVEALRPRRLRYAAALPLLLGLRTLAVIEKAWWPERIKGVKIPRSDVGRILVEAGVAALRRDGLRRMAERLAQS